MALDNTFWTFIGLVVFLFLLGYLGVFGKVTVLLDGRATRIARELEEARRLREEAQALLAEYQKKRLAAEKEAEEIIETAKGEAVRIAAEAEVSLSEMIERRTRATETKIAQAEKQALAEVKALAADVAVRAATQILETKVTGDVAADLLTKSISDVKARLN
ncbi:MAG TPA: ATP F0F1 synthase subunit B [Methylomirabilota bacterium]|nr:ATP F0F1 synthase subunit B [Methylomirabilota bacterium]